MVAIESCSLRLCDALKLAKALIVSVKGPERLKICEEKAEPSAVCFVEELLFLLLRVLQPKGLLIVAVIY